MTGGRPDLGSSLLGVEHHRGLSCILPRIPPQNITRDYPVKPYLESGRPLDAVRNVTVLFCGRCEREFLAKLKEGQDHPTYECPKCKSANRFSIVWR